MNNKDITLGKFLKSTGDFLNDQLMMELINSGGVRVNGRVENDPDRKLYHADEVEIGDQIIVVGITQQEE